MVRCLTLLMKLLPKIKTVTEHYQVTLKATIHNFKLRPVVLKIKLNDQCYDAAQNSNFGETGSYFIEKISSGFPPDVLQLLGLNSVIYGHS